MPSFLQLNCKIIGAIKQGLGSIEIQCLGQNSAHIEWEEGCVVSQLEFKVLYFSKGIGICVTGWPVSRVAFESELCVALGYVKNIHSFTGCINPVSLWC